MKPEETQLKTKRVFDSVFARTRVKSRFSVKLIRPIQNSFSDRWNEIFWRFVILYRLSHSACFACVFAKRMMICFVITRYSPLFPFFFFGLSGLRFIFSLLHLSSPFHFLVFLLLLLAVLFSFLRFSSPFCFSYFCLLFSISSCPSTDSHWFFLHFFITYSSGCIEFLLFVICLFAERGDCTRMKGHGLCSLSSRLPLGSFPSLLSVRLLLSGAWMWTHIWLGAFALASN